jgi:hypothetical protein
MSIYGSTCSSNDHDHTDHHSHDQSHMALVFASVQILRKHLAIDALAALSFFVRSLEGTFGTVWYQSCA